MNDFAGVAGGAPWAASEHDGARGRCLSALCPGWARAPENAQVLGEAWCSGEDLGHGWCSGVVQARVP